MQLFDSHVHFNAQQYSDEEREQALKEFSEIKDYCNISARTAIDVGFDLNSSVNALKIAELDQDTYAFIGIHPSDVKRMNDRFIKDYLSLENEGGIASLDSTQEFTPISMNPTVANAEQMKEQNNGK